MCFPIVSKSLSVSLGTAVAAKVEPSAREHVPQLVPHLVPPSVIAKRPCRGELRSAQHPKSDAAKTTPWPGATPFRSCCLAGQNPSRMLGSLPATGTLRATYFWVFAASCFDQALVSNPDQSLVARHDQRDCRLSLRKETKDSCPF